MSLYFSAWGQNDTPNVWTSATPLNGNNMQSSLDALLENDIVLNSAAFNIQLDGNSVSALNVSSNQNFFNISAQNSAIGNLVPSVADTATIGSLCYWANANSPDISVPANGGMYWSNTMPTYHSAFSVGNVNISDAVKYAKITDIKIPYQSAAAAGTLNVNLNIDFDYAVSANTSKSYYATYNSAAVQHLIDIPSNSSVGNSVPMNINFTLTNNSITSGELGISAVLNTLEFSGQPDTFSSCYFNSLTSANVAFTPGRYF